MKAKKLARIMLALSSVAMIALAGEPRCEVSSTFGAVTRTMVYGLEFG